MKIKSKLQQYWTKSNNCVLIKAENDNLFMLCVFVDELAVYLFILVIIQAIYKVIVPKIKSVYELSENR